MRGSSFACMMPNSGVEGRRFEIRGSWLNSASRFLFMTDLKILTLVFLGLLPAVSSAIMKSPGVSKFLTAEQCFGVS